MISRDGDHISFDENCSCSNTRQLQEKAVSGFKHYPQAQRVENVSHYLWSNLTTYYKSQALGKDKEEEYQNRSRIARRDKSLLQAEQSKIVLLKCSYGLMLILGLYYKGFGKKARVFPFAAFICVV